jgi:hypothetical protein
VSLQSFWRIRLRKSDARLETKDCRAQAAEAARAGGIGSRGANAPGLGICPTGRHAPVTRTAFLLSSLLCALPSAEPGAQVLYTLLSPNGEAEGLFGHCVSGAGDVDGDGFHDIIVGAPRESPGSSPPYAGRAYVFCGATAAVLYTLVSPDDSTGGHFGRWVSGAGDVNNDGHADVIVGAPYTAPGSSPDGAGRAYVFSGMTGSALYTLASPNEEQYGLFGNVVSTAGDIDDDGYDDVIVGARNEDPGASPLDAGRAYVFSGATGALLYTLVSPNEEQAGEFGYSVCAAGDVSGDGYADVIVGAWKEDVGPGLGNAGRAYVFSGASGDTLYSLTSPNAEASGRFGFSVSGAGDADGDGACDVVIGAYFEDPGLSPRDAGRAYLFSGATGAVVHVLASPNEEDYGYFGFSVSGAGDMNNDGSVDVIVGAYQEDAEGSPEDAGRAYAFSGATGAVLWDFVSPNEELEGLFGYSVVGVGYVDADSCSDLVVGAYREDPGGLVNAGRAYVFAPALALMGHADGDTLKLHWSAWPATVAYWLFGESNNAYFRPEFVPPYRNRLAVFPGNITDWSTAAGIADPDTNWTYVVAAVDASGREMARSNRLGEHDFGLSTAPVPCRLPPPRRRIE